MNRRNILSPFAVAVLGLALLPSSTFAQQRTLKEQLVGTWTLVSAGTTAQDGTNTALFGANPKGILMFDAGGRFTQVQVRSDRPKFKSNNRLEGTAEENKATIAGGVGQFGTWSANETDKTFIMHMEGNVSFPNEEGTDQKRNVISLTASELKYLIPTAGSGGRVELVYSRAK